MDNYIELKLNDIYVNRFDAQRICQVIKETIGLDSILSGKNNMGILNQQLCCVKITTL